LVSSFQSLIDLVIPFHGHKKLKETSAKTKDLAYAVVLCKLALTKTGSFYDKEPVKL
jgi:hypothetical protein